jgi:hypothetical protein
MKSREFWITGTSQVDRETSWVAALVSALENRYSVLIREVLFTGSPLIYIPFSERRFF